MISILEKDIAKKPTFMQKGIDTRNANNAHGSALHKGRPQCQQLSENGFNDETYHGADHRRFMRKHSRLRYDRSVLLKLGTVKTVEKTHNTADTKYSVSHVEKFAVKSKHRRDSIQS